MSAKSASETMESQIEVQLEHTTMRRGLKEWVESYLTKYRIGFLIFLIVYAYLVTIGLDYSAIQWDETNHLNGGILILQGNFASYLGSNGFYPPMYDVFTAIFFGLIGPSVFAGRLVSVIFSALSIYVVFEFAYRTYGPKIALISSILLSITPGYIYISRLSLAETMAVFFLTASLVLFFNWVQKRNNVKLVLSGVTLGFAFLVKYQMVIGIIIVLAALLLLSKERLRWKFGRFLLVVFVAVIIALPWFLFTYQIYASGMLGQWNFALTLGNPERFAYDSGVGRLPHWFLQSPSWLQHPLFYSLEMTIPYFDTYPVSLGFYLLGICGLAFFALRRKPSDKFLLIWFVVSYVFFTLIPNKQWRYMAPVFPVLAISASSLFVVAFEKTRRAMKAPRIGINRKRAAKAGVALLVFFFGMSMTINIRDAHWMVAKDWVHVPTEDATESLAGQLEPKDAIMLLCPQNRFNDEMIQFNLNHLGKQNQLMHYPDEPIDAFVPNFNTTELIDRCEQNNVKYILLLENEEKLPNFDPTLNSDDVLSMLYSSNNEGNFSQISKQTTIGDCPHRIYIITFTGQKHNSLPL